MKNDIAVVNDDFLKLKRNYAGTEKTQVMEWLTIANISPEDALPTKKWDRKEMLVVEIPKEELIQWGVCHDGKNFTRDLLRLHAEMSKLLIAASTAKSALSFVAFPDLSYDTKTGLVTVLILPRFAPYITKLKSDFTKVELHFILTCLTDFWVRKMYAIFRNELHQDSDMTTLTITPDELNKRLGCNKAWDNLKKRVITPAVKSINAAEVDISIGKPVYKRRYREGIVSINFLITRRKDNTIENQGMLALSPQLSNLSHSTIEMLDSIDFWKRGRDRIDKLAHINSTEVIEKAVRDFIKDTKDWPKSVNLGGVLAQQINKYIAYAQDSLHRQKYKLSARDESDLREIYEKRKSSGLLIDPNMTFDDYVIKFIDSKEK